MEIMEVVLDKVIIIDENMIQAQWSPKNIELYNVGPTGSFLNKIGSIKETTDAYEPIAARELLIQAERLFPGQYKLDPKYHTEG